MSNGNQPVVASVIMPVYNEQAYLEASLNSFFAQTIAERCELICIDDGSTDASLSILERFAARHPGNMTILRQRNQGSGPARNQGLAVAKGSYVGFLDADDLYPSDSVLELLSSALTRSGCEIAGGSLVSFNDEVESSQFVGIEGFEGHQFTQEGVVEYRDYQFDYGYQRFLYSKDLLFEHDVRFPEFLRYQDPPFFVSAMVAAKRFYAIVEPTYKYRTARGMTHWTMLKLDHMFKAIRRVAELAVEHDLRDLYMLNLRRFDIDNAAAYHDYMFSEGDLDFIPKLRQARKELVEMGEEAGFRVNAPAISPFECEVKNALRRYDDFANCLDEASILIDELEARLNARDDELSRIYSSSSWRVGRLMTAPVRYAKDQVSARS